MPSIVKVSDRLKLKPQREPYWHRLNAGCYVGIRVMTAGSAGSWIARWRDPDAKKQVYMSLGTFEDVTDSGRFDAAAKAARAWFTHVGHGGSTKILTIKDACDRYVSYLKGAKGDASAKDAESRFARHVLADERFASTILPSLRPDHIVQWRKQLRDRILPQGRPPSASSLNRDMTALRAALNHAHSEGFIATNIAWRSKLAPVSGADKSRGLYLDREQRRRLIQCSPPDLALLIQAMSLLPLRPGAIAALNVEHYDNRLKTLTIGKDKARRDRHIQLSSSAAKLFAEVMKERPSSEPLLSRADGKRWNKDAWKHPIKAAALAAELPTKTCAYTLRHSVITDLVIGGLPLLTVAQMSGTSVRMIEQHYGHLRSETAVAALEALAL